jgi:hypothetical protein
VSPLCPKGRSSMQSLLVARRVTRKRQHLIMLQGPGQSETVKRSGHDEPAGDDSLTRTDAPRGRDAGVYGTNGTTPNDR